MEREKEREEKERYNEKERVVEGRKKGSQVVSGCFLDLLVCWRLIVLLFRSPNRHDG